MYGTVMIAKRRGSPEEFDAAMDEFLGRHVAGFRGEQILLSDDGETVVAAVVFDSKADYMALADDPVQDEFYRTRLRPLLAEDPQWIDGEWIRNVTAAV